MRIWRSTTAPGSEKSVPLAAAIAEFVSVETVVAIVRMVVQIWESAPKRGVVEVATAMMLFGFWF